MIKKHILEICAESLESAINAAKGGADRIELCAALNDGGTTPSAGIIEAALNILNIPVHVLIRPRGGDFCYEPSEINVMLRDIEICKDLGIHGIVTGALLPNGKIDNKACRLLIDKAKPLDCTFHRAFDITSGPLQAMEDVISLGFDRILTSGQKPVAEEGIGLIIQLIKAAGKRLTIMPGAGINETNIESIIRSSGATDFHMSLRSVTHSTSPLEKVLQIPGYMSTDAARVRKVREILDAME
jgi:copper homeostasis protein